MHALVEMNHLFVVLGSMLEELHNSLRNIHQQTSNYILMSNPMAQGTQKAIFRHNISNRMILGEGSPTLGKQLNGKLLPLSYTELMDIQGFY